MPVTLKLILPEVVRERPKRGKEKLLVVELGIFTILIVVHRGIIETEIDTKREIVVC